MLMLLLRKLTFLIENSSKRKRQISTLPIQQTNIFINFWGDILCYLKVNHREVNMVVTMLYFERGQGSA